jgi:predicted MFS family arabinose efflux permease
MFPLMSGALALVSWRHPFLVYLSAFLILPGIFRTLYEPDRSKSSEIETEHETAMIGIPVIVLIYALGVSVMIAFYMLPVQLPFHLRELVGASPGVTGVVLASVSVAGGIASLLFRRVKRWFSYPGLIALTFSMIGIGNLLIAWSEGYVLVVVGIGLVGLGLGWTNPNLSLWLINGTPERIRGRLVGGMAMGFFLGQFISPIIARPFIETGGYANAYRVTGGVMLALGIAFLLSRLLRPRGKTPHINEDASA